MERFGGETSVICRLWQQIQTITTTATDIQHAMDAPATISHIQAGLPKAKTNASNIQLQQ